MFLRSEKLTEENQKLKENQARSLFAETSIPSYYKLESFNNDSNTIHERITATFIEKFSQYTPEKIELSKLLIKNPELSIQKILTRREHKNKYDYSGNSLVSVDRSESAVHSIWFNKAEDANLFYQQLDLEIAPKKGKYWEPCYVTLEDKCITTIHPLVMTAAVKLLSSNILLEPLLKEHMAEAPLPIKASVLNPQPSSFMFTTTSLQQAERKSIQAITSNPEEATLKSLFEKCSVELEHAENATFRDLVISSDIYFPYGTSKAHLKQIADKFTSAGLPCSIDIGETYLPPHISIKKRPAELKNWVQEVEEPKKVTIQKEEAFPKTVVKPQETCSKLFVPSSPTKPLDKFVQSLMEKCSVELEYAENATFSDLIIHSGIDFPHGTSREHLKQIADKFISAGLPCSIDIGGTYLPPRISIKKRPAELKNWVQETRKDSSVRFQ